MSRPAPSLQVIQDAQGYLITAGTTKQPIGTVLSGFRISRHCNPPVADIPVVVIGYADLAEFQAQAKRFAPDIPQSMTDPPQGITYYFHKVIAE